MILFDFANASGVWHYPTEIGSGAKFVGILLFSRLHGRDDTRLPPYHIRIFNLSSASVPKCSTHFCSVPKWTLRNRIIAHGCNQHSRHGVHVACLDQCHGRCAEPAGWVDQGQATSALFADRNRANARKIVPIFILAERCSPAVDASRRSGI